MKRTALSRKSPLKRGKPLDRGGRLNPISKRRRKRDAHYAEQRAKAFAKTGGWCEYNGREYDWLDGNCTARATDVHHVAGRGGKDPHRLDNLKVLCRLHHDWVHANPREAYNLGLLRHRHAVHDEGEVA